MKRFIPLATGLAVVTVLIMALAVAPAIAQAAPAPPTHGALLATLMDPGGMHGDFFGTAVAVDGNTAVVGSTGDKAYIYIKGRNGWPTTPTVTLSDPGLGGDFFGSAVAIKGTTIVVAASSANVGSTFAEGAVYIYEKGRTGWPTSPTASLFDPTATTGDAFGSSVALTVAGNGTSDLIVMEPGTYPAQGAAYIYTKNEGRRWPTSPSVTLPNRGRPRRPLRRLGGDHVQHRGRRRPQRQRCLHLHQARGQMADESKPQAG